MLEETVARAPNRMALTVKREGEWRSWTYHQYQAEVVTVAKAFISLGLAPHHSVGILGESLGDTDEKILFHFLILDKRLILETIEYLRQPF